MINPFYVLVFSGITVISMFFLKWSIFYNQLSLQMYMFFIINTATAFSLGFIFRKKLRYKNTYFRIKYPKLIGGVILLGFLFDILYSKEIPLVSMLTSSGSRYDEVEHLPLFYPLLSSVNVFVIVCLFYSYLCCKNKVCLYVALLLLFPFVINVGRGLVVMSIVPCLLMYLSTKNMFLSVKKIATIFLVLLSILYVFGYAGNIRSASVLSERLHRTSTDEIILSLGGATEEFKESYIPSEFLWGYLYVVSPICNLNNNILIGISEGGGDEFFVYNFAPQSMQKNMFTKFEKDKSFLVVDTFNVSTAFALPYSQFGWAGVFFFQVYLYVLFFFFLFLLQKSKYKIIYLSLFSTSMLLVWFENVLVLDVIAIPLCLSATMGVLKILCRPSYGSHTAGY